jgi:riboflavin synthase
VAKACHKAGRFQVWLFPGTLRITTFGGKDDGTKLNIEIEWQTQHFVDTVRDAIEENLGPLLPALERLLTGHGQSLDGLAERVKLPKS